ncbi:MAG: glycosyl transferase, partial [Spirochaetota bacterium]
MRTGILVGYFAGRQEARDAFRKLRGRGYFRAAWVSRGTEGEMHAGDPFPWYRICGAAAAFILLGGAAAAVWPGFWWPAPMFSRLPSAMIPAASGGVIGILLGVVWIRRKRFGVERRLLQDHARWLIAGDTALILQAPVEKLRVPAGLLLESGGVPPAVFVLHPRCDGTAREQGDPAPGGTPLGPAQVQDHARSLAAGHRLDAEPLRNAGLLRRLERDRRLVQQVCLELSEASQLRQSVPPTAEWLLDNEYILESNARDVRLNLPWSYYRQLPALAGEPHRGLPRIYSLARELAACSDFLLDRENILAFLEAYQSAAPLSIGELWA